MVSYRATSSAPAGAAWALLAQPARWCEWAPHIRGAWGLGSPEVVEGARGAVRLLGMLPVPARITDKRPARSWTWRVGPVDMVHRVTGRRGGGCEIAVELSAPGPLEPALRATYGPVIQLLVRRLAAAAEGERPGS